jgi:hypothetical protein
MTDLNKTNQMIPLYKQLLIPLSNLPVPIKWFLFVLSQLQIQGTSEQSFFAGLHLWNVETLSGPTAVLVLMGIMELCWILPSDVSGRAQSPEPGPVRPFKARLEAGLGSGFQQAWAWLEVQKAQSPGLITN